MALNLPPNLILEKNKLSSNNPWIILLDIKLVDGTHLYIARNTEDIEFKGNTYKALPFEIEPTKTTSKGEIPTVTLRISNVSRALQPYVEEMSGAVDASVKITVINVAYLDEDYAQLEMTFDVIATEVTDQWIIFTLGIPNPLSKRFPPYRYIAEHCNWKFKDPYCLLPDNYILMEDGRVEMICDVKKYDVVVTSCGVGYIREVIPRKYCGEYIKIKSYYLPYELKITPDHLILSVRKEDLYCPKYPAKKRRKTHIFVDHYSKCRYCSASPPEPSFIKAENLREGDFIGVSFNHEIVDIKYFDLEYILRAVRQPYITMKDKICIYRKFKKEPIWFNKNLLITNDLLEFIGYFLAEGSITKTGITFAFHQDEIEYINDVLRIANNIFGLDGKIQKQKNSKAVQVRFDSKLLSCLMLYLCGKYALRKRMCKELMLLPPKKQLYILKGLFRGDGYLKKYSYCNGYHGVSWTTASRDLSWQIWTILLRNGMIPIFQVSKKPNNYVHNVTVNQKDGNILSNIIFGCKSKYQDYSFKEAFIKDGILFFKIRKIERSKYNGIVYDLQIEDSNHTFIANGIIVHNCGYKGNATYCNRTYEMCKKLGNTHRFGGFRGLQPGGFKLVF